MKFGKTLAKRQLDIPDYAVNFVNYKALKKVCQDPRGDFDLLASRPQLIKSLLLNRNVSVDPQAALQANRATFFFRLERELEKVNSCYLQKEDELKLRLKSLCEKKDLIKSRNGSTSRISTNYISLREGFRQFESELQRLQQFVDINATAFSKILKKWDKLSKSSTKELYLSRAVEVQPCFNREVISALSDQATTSVMQLEAWAEGENLHFEHTSDTTLREESKIAEHYTDIELQNAIFSDNPAAVHDWIRRIQMSERASERLSRIFLSSILEGNDECLKVCMATDSINYCVLDDINERNCLHEAVVAGKLSVFYAALSHQVDMKHQDVYGRLPLHYAAMHGRLDMLRNLVARDPNSTNARDHNNYTPLVHSIIQDQRESAVQLINAGARIDARDGGDHVPLNLACQHSSEDLIKVLLERRARIVADAEGLFPQHIVARSGRSVALLALLQTCGADINEMDKVSQWTPLFYAAAEGHLQCLRTLLELGAQVNKLDENGCSALYYAAWEGHLDCIELLSAATGGLEVSFHTRASPASASASSGLHINVDSDGIPDLSLPPPILPLRRYGHNFLENTTLIQLLFRGTGPDAISFDGDTNYPPAARLTISSRSSEFIPRNLPLPLSEDTRSISFQIQAMESSFSADFDIYPAFGSRVVARTVALRTIFDDRGLGSCTLPLFDSRIRAVGKLTFDYRIVNPLKGIPLEITHFATYWKATSQVNVDSTTMITGSSLEGEYLRLHVQLTADSVPVLFSQDAILIGGLEIPIHNVSYYDYQRLISKESGSGQTWQRLQEVRTLESAYTVLASSFVKLSDVLHQLPKDVHVEIHIGRHAPHIQRVHSLDKYADTVLNTVFDHARDFKHTSGFTRSMMFSSSDMGICTALNWKQPNFPVFFSSCGTNLQYIEKDCSMKDAVRFASSNNLMGLISPSPLLEMVPPLSPRVKSCGLVLVAQVPVNHSATRAIPGVDGILTSKGVLRFQKAIDM